MMKIAIVIVTYKRQALLQRLLLSIKHLSESPNLIIIVDNENSLETKKIISAFQTSAVKESFAYDVEYLPQDKNGGGAGGFSVGVKQAFENGADWIWVMDDDVEVIPTAIEDARYYFDKVEGIVGNRLDYWSRNIDSPYWINTYFGIANPLRRVPFKSSSINTVKTNIFCFEGAFISRKVVERIGPPDSRFFIYWDDVCYGVCASQVGKLLRVNIPFVKRTRKIASKKVGSIAIDRINNFKRYYMIRNRGLMAIHFNDFGLYRPLKFQVGNLYVYSREVVRMIISGNFSKQAIKSLNDGWKDMKQIVASIK